MRPGTLIFKCRLCGKHEEGIHTPDVMLTIMYLMGEIPEDRVPDWINKGIPISSTGIHSCTSPFEGCTGVSDLVGGREDKRN